MSQEVSVPTPTFQNQFSAQLDLSGIDPKSVIGRLSKSLQSGDQFAIYGSQDPASTGSSVNLTYVANVFGNDGESAASPQFSGWRFLFVKRLLNSSTFNPGTFFASGNSVTVPPIAPVSVTLPTLNNFAGLSLTSFNAPVRLSLGENMTSQDVFDVFATDDPTATNTRGATFVGQIQGGGSALPLGSGTGLTPNQIGPGLSAPNSLVVAYTNILIQRTGGSTPGSIFAWSATDASLSPSASAPSKLNKSMPASTTTLDDQLACATPVAALPVGWVGVEVNGVGYDPGDGTNVGVPCYFSGDGGTTPRAQDAIQVGDLLYWVGSVAGFQLNATTDVVDFIYNA